MTPSPALGLARPIPHPTYLTARQPSFPLARSAQRFSARIAQPLTARAPLVSVSSSTFLSSTSRRTPLLRSARTPTARGPAPPRAHARDPLASHSTSFLLLQTAARAQDRAIRCPRSVFPAQNPAEITGARPPSSCAEDHGLILYLSPAHPPTPSPSPPLLAEPRHTVPLRIPP
jgi:hypothetical protein